MSLPPVHSKWNLQCQNGFLIISGAISLLDGMCTTWMWEKSWWRKSGQLMVWYFAALQVVHLWCNICYACVKGNCIIQCHTDLPPHWLKMEGLSCELMAVNLGLIEGRCVWMCLFTLRLFKPVPQTLLSLILFVLSLCRSGLHEKSV